MSTLHPHTFPHESLAYRAARNKLLRAEIALRKQIETVAALRRKLPQGGKLSEDYVFEELVSGQVKQTKLSTLFKPGKNTLIVYGMMFHPDDADACPMCTSIVDGLDGQSNHVNDRVNLVIIAKAPLKKLTNYAKKRGWRHMRLLSSYTNTFNTDYLAEDKDGNQLPMLNVFQKKADGLYHFYGTELLYVSEEPGQNDRHVDLIWPLWNLFDYTPEGRGTDWYPKLSY